MQISYIEYNKFRITLYYHKNKVYFTYKTTHEIQLQNQVFVNNSFNERFLLVDTNDEDRILVFSSNWQLEVLIFDCISISI